MNDTASAVVPEVIQEEPIGAVVMQKDAVLIKAITDTRASLQTYLKTAEATVLKRAEDKQIVTDMIASIKNICKPVVELIQPIKKQANEQIDKIISIEKIFTTYVPPNQAAKTRADERFLAWKAIDILMTKLDAYLNYEEEERRKEEERLQKLAEQQRQKETERINKKLEGLLAKSDDLKEQKRLLEEQLQDGSITVEEAENIRTRIENIDIRLQPIEARVVDQQVKMEEKAMPVTVSVDKGPKVAGLSSDNFYWDVEEITNVKLICRAIVEGTLSPACVTVNQAKVKQAGNDQVKGTNQAPNIPGVKFIKKRKMSVSTRGRGE